MNKLSINSLKIISVIVLLFAISLLSCNDEPTSPDPANTAPNAPVLYSPVGNDIATNPTASWYRSSRATSYHIQLSDTISFPSFLVDESGILDTTYLVDNLTNSTTYYWRVRANNSYGNSAWSTVLSFTTVDP